MLYQGASETLVDRLQSFSDQDKVDVSIVNESYNE